MPIALPKNGENFTLRSFTHGDAVRLAELEFDTEVKRFLAIPKKSKATWIAEFTPSKFHWAVDIDGVIAGRASLLPYSRADDRELAIVIGKPFWGAMLGRKVAALLIRSAFDELSLKTVVAIVHPDNNASIKLLRAFRFRRRGVVSTTDKPYQQGFLIYRMSRESYNKLVGNHD